MKEKSSINSPFAPDPLLRLEKGRMGYSHSFFSQELHLEILRGEFWHLVGPNGGGKSTLLKILMGEIPLLSGKMEKTFHPREVGYVPQFKSWNQLVPFSLQEFVEQGNTLYENKEWTQHILEICELISLKRKNIQELSGGELQRACLARAIVNKPKILFIDELGTFLDPQNEEKLHQIVWNYYQGDCHDQKKSRTVVMINHNLQMLAKLPGKILWIDQRNDDWRFVEKKEVLEKHKIQMMVAQGGSNELD
jgi:zinc transport system ATP-binding protein